MEEEQNKKVSVIIPTYKRATYIERAINSVLLQTYKNFEIIIVDDNGKGTDDGKALEKIIKKYTKKYSNIKYIQHETNMNGANARNTGIKQSVGDYITFLDDDDYFLENRLQKLVEALESNPEYACVYTGGVRIRFGKINKMFNANKSGNLKFEFLCQNSLIGTGSNMFFRADALKQLNGFDGSFLRHQDLEVLVRFFRKYKMLAVNDVLVVKTMDNPINMPNIDNLIKYRDKYLKTFKKDIEEYNLQDRTKIYKENYSQLLKLSITAKNKKAYKEIKNKMKEYCEYSLKDKLKNFVYKIYKKLPIIIRFKENKMNKKYRNVIDKKILEEIDNKYKLNYTNV